jgi:outer membrane protein assembly factor BamB
MLKLFLLVVIVLCSACRAKYNTSKAVEILSTDEALPDYRLKDVPLQVESTNNVVDVHEYKAVEVKNLNSSFGESLYNNGFVYSVNSHKLALTNMENLQTIEIKHNIHDAKITVTNTFALLFNISGKFSFIDVNTKKELWSDVIETQGFASGFACIDSKKTCYALTLNGDIIILDLENYAKTFKPLFQKQSVVLNEIYTPLVFENQIVFAVGNSEFAIFDTSKEKVVAQSSFVEEENSSMFDVNLVQNFYETGGNIIISHINGAYAFNILYGRPLWAKKFVFHHAFVTNNYIIFFEEKTHKLVCIHIETGEIKWTKEVDFNSLGAYIDYNKQLVVLEANGIHLFDTETGGLVLFKKIDINNIEYFFVDNHSIYYIENNKIYKIQ